MLQQFSLQTLYGKRLVFGIFQLNHVKILFAYTIIETLFPICLTVSNGSSRETPVENVLFIHGFLCSSSIWTETVFQNLSERGQNHYRLIAVDLLGFGRSPKPRGSLYTLRDHLEMIEKSVIIPNDLKSFHLVAHSMGCIVALAVADKYCGSVKSVTLLAPVSSLKFKLQMYMLFNLHFLVCLLSGVSAFYRFGKISL